MLFFACTKEISLSTEVEFELIEQHQENGFVNQPLSSTFTVVPEEIIENYTYSLSYELSSGDGGYLTLDGNPVSQGEQFPMTGLSSSFSYQGSMVGSHEVLVRATDNFGFTEQVSLTYVLNNVPAAWTATGSANQVELGTSTAITLVLSTDSSVADLTFERNYVLVTGQGILSDSAGQTLVLNTFSEITPGTYLLNFTPSELGTVSLNFVLRDSNGQELIEQVSFEVVTEIADNTPPTLTILGDNPLEVIQNSDYMEPGATAIDIVDGDLTSQIIIDNSAVDTSTIGTYLVTYTVSDSAMNSSTDTRTVSVISDTNGNQPPVAQNDSFTTTESNAFVDSVFPNNGNGADTDPEGALFTVDQVNGTAANVGNEVDGNGGGKFTIAANGDISFNPNGEFDALNQGEQSTSTITYRINDGTNFSNTATVTVTITGVNATNQAPVAQDDNFTTTENVLLNNNVFLDHGNGLDTDPEGANFTVDQVNGATTNVGIEVNGNGGGKYIISANGNISFNPNGEFDALNQGEQATTTVTYRINDGTNFSNTATVTVTITGVNATNQAPVAQNDDFTTAENNAFIDNVFPNNGNGADTDPEGALFTVDQVNGTTANVGIEVDGNGGGKFTIFANGDISFNPNGEFDALNQGQQATATINYRINDGTNFSNTATVIVTVTGVNPTNQAPVAENDTFTTAENVTLNDNVFLNNGNGPDSDPEGQALTVDQVAGDSGSVGTQVNGIGGGLFTISSNGDISFNPNGEFNSLNDGEQGTAAISYRITDGTNFSNTATVVVTVTGVSSSNTAPNALSFSFPVAENSTNNTTDLSSRMNDPDGDPLTVIIQSGPSNGTASLTGTILSYTPTINYTGNDEIIFRVSDGSLTTDGTISIIVKPLSSFDPQTGILIAPSGADIEFTLNGGGGPGAIWEAQMGAYSNSNLTGILGLITIPNGGGNNVSFTMPASGTVYFNASHINFAGPGSGSGYEIFVNGESIASGGMDNNGGSMSTWIPPQ